MWTTHTERLAGGGGVGGGGGGAGGRGGGDGGTSPHRGIPSWYLTLVPPHGTS